MKHHEIDLEGLQNWLDELEITFASSTRERKRLIVDSKGNFRVTVNGKTIWQGMQPFAAVEAYNSITEKFVPEKFTL